MGLGPPVCEHCRVVCEFLDLPLRSTGRYFKCKYCGNEDPQWNAWDCGLTDEELYENKLFLDFVKGTQEDAPTSRRSNSTE